MRAAGRTVYFAVWATDRAGMLEVRERVRDAHRARLRDPGSHPVRVVLGGPTVDDAHDTMNGTLLVVQAERLADVRRFVAEDPYMLAGVYADVQIRPWRWGLAVPGAGPDTGPPPTPAA
jgi:uncharacterized protein YciI